MSDDIRPEGGVIAHFEIAKGQKSKGKNVRFEELLYQSNNLSTRKTVQNVTSRKSAGVCTVSEWKEVTLFCRIERLQKFQKICIFISFFFKCISI